MRQFILATGFGTDLDAATAGQLVKVDAADGITNLVLKREDAQGGNILFPVYNKDFTAVKSSYVEATTFTANFTVGEIIPYLDYTVTFVKKGLKFNERNKWSAVVHAGSSDTAETIAAKIAKFVEDNKTTLGLTATVAGAEVTVTAVKAGVDYTITFGDELYGTQLTSVTQGTEAQNDAAMIKDLFAKCAADRGYEYTYDDFDIYPGFGFNPLKQADAEDTGFDVYTMRFTEPRLMGTRDDAVYQIIQVAFPTGTDYTDLYTFLNEMLGEEVFV